VCVLHQRQSGELKAGEGKSFCSLVYATGRKHPAEYAVGALRPAAYRVESAKGDAIAGFGPDQAGSWKCDADAWLVDGRTISLVAVRRIDLGTGGLVFAPAANVSLDGGTGQMTVIATRPVSVTACGSARVAANPRLELSPGTHVVAVSGLDDASLEDAHRESPQVTAPQPVAAATSESAAPLWSVTLAAGSPVMRITPADIGGDSRPELLAACGSAGHVVNGNGKLLWSHATAGVVRDVSVAHFAKSGPPTILVSSADTHLYQLDPAGTQLRKDRMIGMYFNVDHGDDGYGGELGTPYDLTTQR